MYLLHYTGTQQAATDLEKQLKKNENKAAIKSILFQQHFKYKINNKETHHLPDLRSTIYFIKFVVSIQVQIGNEAST